MTLDEYQKAAVSFAVYPPEAAVVYPLLGLLEEVGEVALVAEASVGEIRTIAAARVADRLATVIQPLFRCGQMAKRVRAADVDMAGMANLVALTPERLESIKREIGDVIWMAAALCEGLGTTLGEVAAANLTKLADRKARGVIKGEGDGR